MEIKANPLRLEKRLSKMKKIRAKRPPKKSTSVKGGKKNEKGNK